MTKYKVMAGCLSIIALTVFCAIISNSMQPKENTEIPYGIVPLSKIATRISFSDSISSLSTLGMQVNSPKWLPTGFTPESAYVRYRSDKMDKYVVFTFSKSGTDKIETSELTIEVYPCESLPFDKNTTLWGKFIEINGLQAYIYDSAPVNIADYKVLYGDTARLVSIQIGSVNYLLRGVPAISMDEMIKIASSL